MELLKKFWKEEDGQDLIEYALLAGGIALTAIGAVTVLGTTLSGAYGNIDTKVKTVPNT